jgi:hypothetical protein
MAWTWRQVLKLWHFLGKEKRTSRSEADVRGRRGLRRRRRQMRGARDSTPGRSIVSGARQRFVGSTPCCRVFSPIPSPVGAVVDLLARSGSLAEKDELAGVAAGFYRGSLPAAAVAPHVASDVAFGRAKTTSSLVTRRVHARKVFDGMRGQCSTATRVTRLFPRSSATQNRGAGRRRQGAARLLSHCTNLL